MVIRATLEWLDPIRTEWVDPVFRLDQVNRTGTPAFLRCRCPVNPARTRWHRWDTRQYHPRVFKAPILQTSHPLLNNRSDLVQAQQMLHQCTSSRWRRPRPAIRIRLVFLRTLCLARQALPEARFLEHLFLNQRDLKLHKCMQSFELRHRQLPWDLLRCLTSVSIIGVPLVQQRIPALPFLIK